MRRRSAVAQLLQSLASLLCVAFLVTGCASAPSPEDRIQNASVAANANGWAQFVQVTQKFRLTTFHATEVRPDKKLTIYIEGDGFAWKTGRIPSRDPTPINPVALKLALAHPNGNAAYLARPCQYMEVLESACSQHYWTDARFAPEVIEAMNAAVSKLKTTFEANSVSLVGYSGGAAIAALIAARRDDVSELITIAGNLDHAAWTRHHNLVPLTKSLNAAELSGELVGIRQRHFIGKQDKVIPPSLARRWPLKFRGPQDQNLHIIDTFDHACCWDRNWSNLMGRR